MNNYVIVFLVFLIGVCGSAIALGFLNWGFDGAIIGLFVGIIICIPIGEGMVLIRDCAVVHERQNIKGVLNE